MIAGRKAGDTPKGFFAVCGFVGLKAPVLHELGEAGAGSRIVFDNEHSFAGARWRVSSCLPCGVYKLWVSVPVRGNNYTLSERKFDTRGVLMGFR